jgi:hypothetical protein
MSSLWAAAFGRNPPPMASPESSERNEREPNSARAGSRFDLRHQYREADLPVRSHIGLALIEDLYAEAGRIDREIECEEIK